MTSQMQGLLIPSVTLKFQTSLALALHPISPELSSLHISRACLLNQSSKPEFDVLGCRRCGGMSCVSIRTRRSEEGRNQMVKTCRRCGSKRRNFFEDEEQKTFVKARGFPSVRKRARMISGELAVTNALGVNLDANSPMKDADPRHHTRRLGQPSNPVDPVPRVPLNPSLTLSSTVVRNKPPALPTTSTSQKSNLSSSSLSLSHQPSSLTKPSTLSPSPIPSPELTSSASKRSKKKVGLQQMIARHKEQQLQKQKAEQDLTLQSSLVGFLSSL